MAELALLCAVGLAIALGRVNERLRRLEEQVKAQRGAPASRPAPTPAPTPQQPSPRPPGAAPPVPSTAAGTSPGSVPSEEPARTWTPPPPMPPKPGWPPAPRREPIRLKAFGNRTIEEVVSENLLAIVGGLLVIAGAVFFLGLAISRGWIGETGRVVVALVTGSALVAGGLRLGSRVRATSGVAREWAVGSLHGVLCGVGIAVLFLGTVVGTRVYEVLGWAGLPLAVAIGAVATTIAVTWRSQDLAGFGIGGALAAPVLVDAPPQGSTLAFVVVALLASCAVIVAMGWPWLLALALVLTAPQVAVWIAPVSGHGLAGDLSVVAVWNAVILAAAVAAELRQPGGRLRASFASISFLAASTAGGLGVAQVEQHDGSSSAWWLALIAAMHLLAAAAAWAVDRRQARPAATRHATPVWCLLIGSAFAGTAIAEGFDATVVVAAWAFEAVALWWLSVRTSDGRARIVACGFATLAVLHVLVLDAPASQLAYGSDDLARSLLSLAAVSAAAAWAAWFERARPHVASRFLLGAAVAALTGASIAVVTLASPIDPDQRTVSVGAQLCLLALWAGVALVLCALTALRRLPGEWTGFAVALSALVPLWGLEAVPLSPFAEPGTGGEWGVVAGMGAFATLAALVASGTASAVAAAVAAVWTAVAAGRLLLELEWLVDAVWSGSEHLASATVLAVFACAGAGLLLRRRGDWPPAAAPSPEVQRTLWRASAVGLTALGAFLVVYVLSDAVVSALSTGPRRSGTEQDAQMALSLLWGAIGVTAFVVSATQRLPAVPAQAVRRAALALLAVAVLKVVGLDTRQLEAAFRVLVFIGLGSLLLLGAWLDQRLRGATAGGRE